MAMADLLDVKDKREMDKQKALESALAQIERQFGKGSIMKLGADSPALCARLLDATGVALTPGTDFGEHRARAHLRLAYTQPLPRLHEALARLGEVLR